MVLALSSALLVFSGCGLSVAEPTPPPTPDAPVSVVPTDYVTLGVNDDVRQLGNRRYLDGNVGFLVGPHFVLRQQSVGTVQEIGSGLARRIGLQTGIKAPPGHELVVADFADAAKHRHAVPEGGEQPGVRTSGKLRQWVRVGTEYRKLLVVRGTLLIVAAPVGERVWLRVDDGGRTQWLDLRTGRRKRDGISAYYPGRDLTPPDPEGEYGVVRNPAGRPREVDVYTELVDVHAEKSPFNPSGDWARRGKAWIYVRFQAQSDCGDVVCRVEFSPRRDVRLSRSKSARSAPTAGSAFESVPVDTPSGGYTVQAFEVPSSTRSATLAVTQQGTVRLGQGKKKVRARWTERSPAVRVALRPR